MSDYDQERVYVSDIKKVIRWYNLLIESGLLKPLEKEAKPSADTKAKKEVKPKAKTAKPKATKTKAPKVTGAKGKVTKSTSLKSK